MSNIADNRINTVMNEGQVAAVKNYFTQLNAQMPFLLGLTPEERMSIPKINVSNKSFTEDALNIMVNNPGLFPAFVNVTPGILLPNK